MKMTKEDLDEWVQVLEGGTIKQAFHALHTPLGMCCLGVLCDLQKDKLNLKVKSPDEGSTSFRYDGCKSLLPTTVAYRFSAHPGGTSVPIGLLSDEDKECLVHQYGRGYLQGKFQVGLTHLNDSGVPFRRIAEFLRQVVEVIPEYETQSA